MFEIQLFTRWDEFDPLNELDNGELSSSLHELFANMLRFENIHEHIGELAHMPPNWATHRRICEHVWKYAREQYFTKFFVVVVDI